jgi:hypothetical protein
MSRGSAPSTPTPAPEGVWEYIQRLLFLSLVGPLRIPFGASREIPIPDTQAYLVHTNTSAKPMFVDIRLADSALSGGPVYISNQQTCDIRTSQQFILADGYRVISYPSDRLFIRTSLNVATSIVVTEVTL